MPKIDMEFKLKNSDGTWDFLNLENVVGKTIGEIFDMCEGIESVAKTPSGYLCGTQKWVDYYKKRGKKAMLFSRAAEKMATMNLKHVLSHRMMPKTDDLYQCLPEGCVVEKMSVERRFPEPDCNSEEHVVKD